MLGRVEEYIYDLVTNKIQGLLAVFLRGFLFLLSLVYGLGVIILANLYRLKPARFPALVISIGNITLGGTGKTTLVEYLADKLISSGQKVAVLSRGYKRDLHKPGSPGLGDEPAMLERKFPQLFVVVDKNRIRGAQRAIKEHAVDTLLLDDGLQQWRIFKDLEIVTINALDPFGNGLLLPRGFLREPLIALKRADIFVLTQVDLVSDTNLLTDKLSSINSRALIVESVHKPVGFTSVDNPNEFLTLDTLRGKQVAVFSGIGNPQGFESCVFALGLHIGKVFRFADHHDYTQAEINEIMKEARQRNLEAVITTQKDAVKVRELAIPGANILALDIKLSITKNEAEFNRRLLKLCPV
ncbi:MAG: tetraacyldisaccharide 4'-kinase [Candidatus Omnitrophica bacterium]|nr:tetraacyldisaccharide 4'-kinase [Candidatus Omnitrophota bacterium]